MKISSETIIPAETHHSSRIDNPLLLPDYFQKNPDHRSFFHGELALVEYRSYASTERIPVEASGLLFVHVLSGTKILMNDKEKIEIHPGESIFIPRGMYFMGEQIMGDGTPYRSILLFYHTALLEQLIQECNVETMNTLIENTKFIVLNNSEQKEIITEITRFLMEGLDKSDRNMKSLLPLKARELILRLESTSRGSLIRNILGLYTRRSRPDLIPYMLEHYTDPGTALDFSKRTLRTPGAFNREFRMSFGESPAKWLTQKRLEKAAVLLRTTHLNVTEIALSVGYETPGRFIEMFRRQYGITPGRYR